MSFLHQFHAARDSAVSSNTCAICHKEPVLRNELEIREYKISATCGPCWDDLFPPCDDEK